MKNERHPAVPIEDLPDSALESLWRTVNFSDRKAAESIAVRLERANPSGFRAILPYLTASLASAADPDRSLVNFSRFIDLLGASVYLELETHPRVIEILVTLFSNSPFLTEILLHTPDPLGLLTRRPELTERKTIDQFQNEALAACRAAEGEVAQLNALRLYQRRQLLRIGTSDFLDLYDLRAVFSQLSRMAIGLTRACLALAVDQTGVPPDDLAILAVGKLGGWELNYSSDIDLLFVSRKDSPENTRLVKRFIENVTRTTAEGFLYRVDIRLRPWGNDSPLVHTLDGYLQYMQHHARLWERQAYLKARVIAGNLSLGEELRREIEPFLFQVNPQEVRTSILGMKLRTEEFLRQKGRQWGEVKLGEGSIRDIEFVVQSLQLTHPAIRTRATLKAIHELQENGLLSATESHILTNGYIFLRTTEHYLQMIDYRQTYTLPSDPKSLAILARRLGFEGPQAGDLFVERYERHCAAIRSIFLKYVGNEKGKDALASAASAVSVDADIRAHLARMDASYAATFNEEEIRRHAQLAEKIDRAAPAFVDVQLLPAHRWQVTVIGYDFLGEYSLICGLMFVYGMDIIDSQAFTYEPQAAPQSVSPQPPDASLHRPGRRYPRRTASEQEPSRPKIVDVFTVRSMRTEPATAQTWERYSTDLLGLFLKLQAGQRREAQGELARRVGEAFPATRQEIAPLYPIDIDIDNEASARYSVLKIGTTDTMGFLYEFSNALALNHINIARMDVRSIGKRVSDTIFVTDEKGQKITALEKQRELRAATVLIKHFTHLLPHSPNPQAALLHFREFLGQLFARPNWPDELARLEQPQVLEALAHLLGVSDFLWDDFLRMQYSNLFPVVRDVDELAHPRSYEQLQSELEMVLSQGGDWRDALNSFKDREMFRIDMRHILGQTKEFWDFSTELSDLVELVTRTAYQRGLAEARGQYGEPLQEAGRACPCALFALGKFGGRELGFASDIELMFIYAGDGMTTGPKAIPANQFFEELVQAFVQSVRAREEGIFRIDLQLRPYGKAGSLAVRLDAFQAYYAPAGPAWDYERQALVKLRPVIGEPALMDQVAALRDQYVYHGGPFDVTAMRAMRERQLRHLVTAGTFNAKYSPGGLVDIEYLVQALQITYGGQDPNLRVTNIRRAMEALKNAGKLSAEDYTSLKKAHTFLRWLIDAMRMVRGNTNDVNIPPFESEEFAFLAKRLEYGSETSRLQEDLTRYQSTVQEISQRLLAGL